MPRTPSARETLILEMLLSGLGKEMYGLEMVEAAMGRLPRGTVYVTLDRMEDKGLVKSRLEPPGPNLRGMPRRLYRITGQGQNALRDRAAGGVLSGPALRGAT